MIKVIEYIVTTDDCDVSHSIKTYESKEELLDTLDEEYGPVDVQDVPIRDLFDHTNGEIVIEGDVWFGKWVILDYKVEV